eukprot:m.203546 g.203546  ORF g.203546 m.203546 type:complete len:3713 (+) comp18455_c2_seq3:139-11277(+)
MAHAEEVRLSLQAEREDIQKRAFTRWINAHLSKIEDRHVEIEELYRDLADGTRLIMLCEVISGESLPPPARGRLRVHRIENVGKALSFLRTQKLKLGTISAENIVDGVPVLVLGLVWTLILRFQVGEIKMEGDAKSAKEALLYWCRKCTQEYSNVSIDNFTTSWKDGLAFNAIIHHFRPDLIDYGSMSAARPVANMNQAFGVADHSLGIASLLEPQDVVRCTDEKSVLAYIASYYHYFSKLHSDEVDHKRLAKLVSHLLNVEDMQLEYEELARELLEWVVTTTQLLESRKFPNSLHGMQALLTEFKTFRTVEKPPKFVLRGTLESHLFAIQTLLFAHHQPMYHPPEGVLISDINDAWSKLETAEHGRELALRAELIRQERLEQLAAKFDRKAELRESWLEDNERIISIEEYGASLTAAAAALKRHEAIDTDVQAHRTRIQALISISEELQNANYHHADDIADRVEAVLDMWKRLCALLNTRRQKLDDVYKIQLVFQQMSELETSMQELLVLLSSDDTGKHLQACEDLMQRHLLHQDDVALFGERVRTLCKQAQDTVPDAHPLDDESKRRQDALADLHKHLDERAAARKQHLSRAVEFQLFSRDADEVDLWIHGMESSVLSTDVGKDVTSATSLAQKHQALLMEIQSFDKSAVVSVRKAGEQLIKQDHFAAEAIAMRNEAVSSNFENLKMRADKRKRKLEDALLRFKFHADADEAVSWVGDRTAQAGNDDFGKDTASTESLLKKHNVLFEEIEAYSANVEQLKDSSLYVIKRLGTTAPVEADECAGVAVKASFSYDARRPTEVSMSKGDILTLVSKSTADWWKVETSAGAVGYVPASYLKESKKKGKSRSPAVRPVQPAGQEVQACMQDVEQQYSDLKDLMKRRLQQLHDTKALHDLNREVNEFESWMADKQALAQSDDLGADYEHAAALMDKFKDLTQELSLNSPRMNKMNEIGSDLAARGQTSAADVLEQVNKRWETLQQLAAAREAALHNSCEVQEFIRNADEAQSLISEKATALSFEDYGKDLASVEALQRKHEGFRRDVSALGATISHLQTGAGELAEKHKPYQGLLKAKTADLSTAWEQLVANTSDRTTKLEESKALQLFRNAVRDIGSQAQDLAARLASTELAANIEASNVLLEQHEQDRLSIETHGQEVKALMSRAKELQESGHFASEELAQHAKAVEVQHHTLSAAWKDRVDALQQNRAALLFARDTHQLEAFLERQEAALENSSLGDSVDAVDELLKQHATVQASMSAMEEPFEKFSAKAEQLVAEGHNDRAAISGTKADLLARRDAVADKIAQRQKHLEEARVMQEIMRDADETSAWISELRRTATDECYKDLTNLNAKLQSHEVFTAHLHTNKPRLATLRSRANEQKAKRHYANGIIDDRVAELEADWALLFEQAAQRGVNLKQAVQQQELNRLAEDQALWCQDMEAALSSADFGKGVLGVRSLLQNHGLVEAEFASRTHSVAKIKELCSQLLAQNHFSAEALEAKKTDIEERFAKLEPLLKRRRALLEQSLKLQQFLHDVGWEESWVKEKAQIAGSSDLGKSLAGVQNLLKNHAVLESEITTHEEKVADLKAEAEECSAMECSGVELIAVKLADLETLFSSLHDAMSSRKARLLASEQLQNFLVDCSAAEVTLLEKQPLASNDDFGKDETSTESSIKKHNALMAELDAHATVAKGLLTQGQRFTSAGHYAADAIASRLAELQDLASEVQAAADQRQKKLAETLDLYKFGRECYETLSWLRERAVLASSTDTGKDLEDCEILQKKFDDFAHDVEKQEKPRLLALQETAATMAAAGHWSAGTIQQQSEDIGVAWEQLQHAIKVRTQELEKARQIHRFNKEAGELASRIIDKTALVSVDDTGKNLSTVQALQRKLEGYEPDLAVLEIQVEQQLGAAKALKEQFGESTDAIEEQGGRIDAAWRTLKDTLQRVKAKLSASYAFHVFVNEVKDTVGDTAELRKSINADALARSTDGAQLQLERHKDFAAPVRLVKDTLGRLTLTGKGMLADNHFEAQSIQEQLVRLEEAAAALDDNFASRQADLQENLDLQRLLRDAGQAHAVLDKQETIAAQAELGDSVEEVAALLDKHDNFQKSIATHQDKINQIVKEAKRLVAAKHFASEQLQEQSDKLLARQEELVEQAKQRQKNLDQSSVLQQVLRDFDDILRWTGQRLQVASDDTWSDLKNLQGKLSKHQAFEGEVAARGSDIKEMLARGTALQHENTVGSERVQSCCTRLSSSWDALELAIKAKEAKLRGALDFVAFLREVDDLNAWMTTVSAVASVEDLGAEVEDTEILQKKHDDLCAEVVGDSARVSHLNATATAFLEANHHEADTIRERQDAFNAAWTKLQQLAQDRKRALETGHQINAYRREVAEARERIEVKQKAVSFDELGKDLMSVQTLQRKHDALLRDFGAIETVLSDLSKTADSLSDRHPLHEADVRSLQDGLVQLWHDVCQTATARKARLSQSLGLQQFLGKRRDLVSWMSDMQAVIRSDDLATDVNGAEVLVKRHLENKGEIDQREGEFVRLAEMAASMVVQDHYAANEIQSKLVEVEEQKDALQKLWALRQHEFEQCHDLQQFLRDAEQTETLIHAQQVVASAKELGESLNGVETLIKKHDDFEKSIVAQEEKTEILKEVAGRLVSDGHYDSDTIRTRLQQVLDARCQLLESVADRRAILEDSRKLHQLVRDVSELQSWIEEKLLTAEDEAYRDASNLQRKLQQHQAFEAEVAANKATVDATVAFGEGLIDAGHYAADDIQEEILDALIEQWDYLEDKCSEKGQRLREAQQEVQFNRRVEDVAAWCTEVETALFSSEVGRDLTSVNQLLKRHQHVEADIGAHKDRIESVMSLAAELIGAGSFLSDTIETKATQISDRYCSLQEPCSLRRALLEASKSLQLFLRRVHDENTWIKEREPVASSTEYGSDLTSAQALLNKHRAFEAECAGREARVQAVLETADQLSKTEHAAENTIAAAIGSLNEAWKGLQDMSASRGTALNASVKAHEYDTHANEAASWMSEKEPLVANSDYGKDEDHALAGSKMHEAVRSDIEAYQSMIDSLRQENHVLVASGHPQADTLQARQAAIDSQYASLCDLCAIRKEKLQESVIFHQFNREANEVLSWVQERAAVVAAQKPPTDQDKEQVEELVKKHDNFHAALLDNAHRLSSVQRLAERRISEGHSQAEHFGTRLAELQSAWDQLLAQSGARHQLLQDALEISSFREDVQETLHWLSEKSGLLDDVYGADLAEVEDLQRKHEIFDRDLAAPGEKVKAIGLLTPELCSAHADHCDVLQDLNSKVIEAWDALQNKAAQRKRKLGDSHDLQLLLSQHRRLINWINEMTHTITNEELANELSACEAQQIRHHEHRAEIDARNDGIAACTAFAQRLVGANHYASADVSVKVEQLKAASEELRQLWEKRRVDLEHAIDMQEYIRDAEQASSWINLRGGFLQERDLTDPSLSLDEIEALLKQQEDFERSLKAQQQKFAALQRHTKFELSRNGPTTSERAGPPAVNGTGHSHNATASSTDGELTAIARLKNSPAMSRLSEKTKGRTSSASPELHTHEGGVIKEGQLNRKLVADSGGKKSSHRTWKTFHVVLKGQSLCFCTAKDGPVVMAVDCASSQCTADMHSKRDCVFSLRPSDGSEMLLQTDDEASVHDWVSCVQAAAGASPQERSGSAQSHGASGSKSRKHGLPFGFGRRRSSNDQ